VVGVDLATNQGCVEGIVPPKAARTDECVYHSFYLAAKSLRSNYSAGLVSSARAYYYDKNDPPNSATNLPAT
jgi:hypothetical protein